MEINIDIKRAIYAQYLNQPFKMILNNNSFFTGKCSLETIILLNTEDILVLKPISSITDNDAIEMAKLFGNIKDNVKLNRPNNINDNDNHFIIQVYTDKPEFISYTIPKIINQNIGIYEYQWLQLKGYDLPHYLLNGKTLYESNLCIYDK